MGFSTVFLYIVILSRVEIFEMMHPRFMKIRTRSKKCEHYKNLFKMKAYSNIDK